MLALNTKLTGYAGIISFIIGLLTYGPFQDAITKGVGSTAAQWLGIIFIVAGFAAAYFGMPQSVPTSAAPPQGTTK
jgi:hypothetical protein